MILLKLRLRKIKVVKRRLDLNITDYWQAKLTLSKNSDEQFIEEFLIAADEENCNPFLKKE